MPRISMDIDGYPWIFGFAAVAWGLPWDPRDIHAHPWISMDINGYLRSSKVK